MYKVIKEFPGYRVGDLITKKSAIYYECCNYPNFFEEIIGNPLTTLDGETVEIGEKVYYVSGLQINNFINYGSHLTISDTLFKNYSKAEEYLHKQIYLKVEDGEVISENIKLYSVCCKAEWNVDSIMSFKLFKSVNFKDSWKFFISKDNRNKYVLENKPRFSNKEVNKLMIEFVVFTDNYKCGLYPQDYTLEKQLEIFKKDYYEQIN